MSAPASAHCFLWLPTEARAIPGSRDGHEYLVVLRVSASSVLPFRQKASRAYGSSRSVIRRPKAYVRPVSDDKEMPMTLSQVPNYSDLELVDFVVLREADALNEIYRRHARSVATIAKMVLGNSSACEDVVAEVFLAFWLKPDSFDAARGTLVGFLRMKARGRSIDIIRTDVARRRREVTDNRAHRAHGGHPDEDIVMLGLAEQLHRTLAALTEKEREPIELAFFTGMTYKDVAEHLDLPEGTVKSRIRSGLHNARMMFENELLAEA